MSLPSVHAMQQILNSSLQQSPPTQPPPKPTQSSPSGNSPHRKSPQVLSGQLLKSRIEDRQLISELYRKINTLEKACNEKQSLNRQLSYELGQVRISLMGVEFQSQKERKGFVERMREIENGVVRTSRDAKERQEIDRSELETVRNQREVLRQENINLLKKIQFLENSNKEESIKITQLQSNLLQKVVKLNEDVTHFSQQKQNSKKPEQTLRKKSIIEKQLSQANRSLLNQRAQHKQMVQNLKKQYQKVVEFRLMKKYQSKINLLSQFKTKISQLQEKNKNLEEEIKKKTQQIRQLGYIIHKYDNQRQIWQAKNNIVQEQNSNLLLKNEESIQKYKVLCQQVQKIKGSFKIHLNQLQSTNQSLKKEVYESNRKASMLKEALIKFEENIRFLTDKLCSSHELISNLQAQLTLTKDKLKQEEAFCEQLQKQLKDIKLSQSDSKEFIEIKSIRKKTKTEAIIRRHNDKYTEQTIQDK